MLKIVVVGSCRQFLKKSLIESGLPMHPVLETYHQARIRHLGIGCAFPICAPAVEEFALCTSINGHMIKLSLGTNLPISRHAVDFTVFLFPPLSFKRGASGNPSTAAFGMGTIC